MATGDGERRAATAADRTYDRLRAWLADGRLPAGLVLSERTLAEELEVSRTPLRAALTRLESEHLVRRSPSGSLQVAPLDEKAIADLYACRTAVDTLAAQLAAERATPAGIARLQAAVDRAGRAYVRGETDEVVQANREFHRLVYELAENEWLPRLVRPLEPHFDRLGALLVRRARQPTFVVDHQAIVDAIASRDPEQVERAVRAHLTSVASRLLVDADGGGGETWARSAAGGAAEREPV